MRARRARGQSLVEFAILLPILVLLTFGTLDMAIFLQRQITLTGAGFLAARAATVGGVEGNNPVGAAREVLRAYGEDAGQAWLQEVVSNGLSVTPESGRTMRVGVYRKGETWSGAAVGAVAALGGNLKPEIGKLGGAIAINRELVNGPGGKSAQQGRSSAKIEYSLDLGPLTQIEARLAPLAGPLLTNLGQIPGVGQYASGLTTVMSFTPLQAVSANPDPTGRRTYSDGRSMASVYASSDNELIKGRSEFRQAGRLLEGLETGAKSTEGLCLALAALKDTPTNPAIPVMLDAFQKGVYHAAQIADVAVKPLEGLNRALFVGTGGKR